jgi:predicted MFS family arabinose efflux permease
MTQSVGVSWMTLQLTDDGFALAAIIAATFGPTLFLGPFVGVVIDRFAHRRILLVTQSAFIAAGITLFCFALTGFAFGGVATLLSISLFTGLVNAVDGPTRQVYLFDLLPVRLLPTAIGLYEIVLNISRVVGPAIGGGLLALSGASACFAFNSLAYFPVLLVLILDTPGFSAPRRPKRGPLLDGIRWFAARPSMLAMAALAVTAGMLFNVSVSIPLVTERTFGLDGGGYGALLTAYGAGALVGAVIATVQRESPTLSGAARIALCAGILISCTAMAPTPGWFGFGLALSGGAGIWFIARGNAFVLLAAPETMRGQVMSLWSMALPGMNPVTGLLIAFIAENVGARQGFAASGVLFILLSLPTLLIGLCAHRSRG